MYIHGDGHKFHANTNLTNFSFAYIYTWCRWGVGTYFTWLVYHHILYLRVEWRRFPSCITHCFRGRQRTQRTDVCHSCVLADPAIAEAAEGEADCVSLTGCHYCCCQTIRYSVWPSDGSGDWPRRLQAPRCPAGANDKVPLTSDRHTNRALRGTRGVGGEFTW